MYMLLFLVFGQVSLGFTKPDSEFRLVDAFTKPVIIN